MTASDHENAKTVSPAEYIQENFPPSDRLAILLRNRAHTVQRIVTAARITEPSFEEWLRYKNDQELYDVYVGMNALKRALARGDDPEEIVRRIADYRAHDKRDPLYYARLTVSKAQAE